MKNLRIALFLAVVASLVSMPSRFVWAAGDSVSIISCSVGLINFAWSVNDSGDEGAEKPNIIVWDGINSENFAEIPLSDFAGEAKGNFASFWGGASNASLAIYLSNNSDISAHCE